MQSNRVIMTFGTPTKEGLQELRKRRSDAEACASSLLVGAQREHRDQLTSSESEQFREFTTTMRALDARIADYEHDLQRVGDLSKYAHLSGSSTRTLNSAGRISSLSYPQSELRRLFD